MVFVLVMGGAWDSETLALPDMAACDRVRSHLIRLAETREWLTLISDCAPDGTPAVFRVFSDTSKERT